MYEYKKGLFVLIVVSVLLGAFFMPATGVSQEMVTICHKPGTPAEKTLILPVSALQGHLGHGDTIGPCGSVPPGGPS